MNKVWDDPLFVYCVERYFHLREEEEEEQCSTLEYKILRYRITFCYRTQNYVLICWNHVYTDFATLYNPKAIKSIIAFNWLRSLTRTWVTGLLIKVTSLKYIFILRYKAFEVKNCGNFHLVSSFKIVFSGIWKY